MVYPFLPFPRLPLALKKTSGASWDIHANFNPSIYSYRETGNGWVTQPNPRQSVQLRKLPRPVFFPNFLGFDSCGSTLRFVSHGSNLQAKMEREEIWSFRLQQNRSFGCPGELSRVCMIHSLNWDHTQQESFYTQGLFGHFSRIPPILNHLFSRWLVTKWRLSRSLNWSGQYDRV